LPPELVAEFFDYAKDASFDNFKISAFFLFDKPPPLTYDENTNSVAI